MDCKLIEPACVPEKKTLKIFHIHCIFKYLEYFSFSCNNYISEAVLCHHFAKLKPNWLIYIRMVSELT